MEMAVNKQFGEKRLTKKRSFISCMTAMILLAALCLTGCSGSFKTDPLVKAAQKNGMSSIPLEGIQSRLGDDNTFYGIEMPEGSELRPVYYVSKDSNEAINVHTKYLSINDRDVAGLESLFWCEDRRSDVYACLMTALTEDTATKLYDEWLTFFREDNSVITSGQKGSCVYTIGYLRKDAVDTSEETDYFGLYKKGKTFFLISASNKTEQGRKEVESFCKALGVVSPFTAKA